MSKDEMQERVVVKKKNKIVLFAGILGVLLLVVLGVVITPHIISANKDRKVNEQLEEAQHFLDDLDYEQAIVAYEAVIEINPMSVDAYLGLASVYEAQEEYEKAISVLEEGYLATNDEALKQRVDELQLLLVVEEEINIETKYEVGNTSIYDIIDADGDGKHDLDVEVLNAIINEQIALGAQLDCNLDSEQYVWVSGRLTEIRWNDVRLSGSLSFSGLEKLTNISCSINQLSYLDVTNNYELIYLSCGGNKLTILDVSNNSNLFELNCMNNKLNNLDVSNNLKLDTLICAYNNLRSINVSNNKELKTLHCHSNSISDIDVSNNLRLQNFACSGNQLNSLNVTNNVELYYLWCGSNQINSLDLSNNNKLTDLECAGNPLVNLDLSNNQALINLIGDDYVEYIGYSGEVQYSYYLW